MGIYLPLSLTLILMYCQILNLTYLRYLHIYIKFVYIVMTKTYFNKKN
jgi:hypothetical protein